MFVLLFFSRLFLKRIAKQPWDPTWAWRRNLSRGQCMRLGVFSPAALSSSFLLWRENNLARFNNAPTLCYSQVAHGIWPGRAALHPPFRAPQTAYHPRAGAFNADDINGTSPLLLTLWTTAWSLYRPKTKGREESLGKLKYSRDSWKKWITVCCGCDSGYMNAMFTMLHEAVVEPTDGGQRSEDTAIVRWFPQLCGGKAHCQTRT